MSPPLRPHVSLDIGDSSSGNVYGNYLLLLFSTSNWGQVEFIERIRTIGDTFSKLSYCTQNKFRKCFFLFWWTEENKFIIVASLLPFGWIWMSISVRQWSRHQQNARDIVSSQFFQPFCETILEARARMRAYNTKMLKYQGRTRSCHRRQQQHT